MNTSLVKRYDLRFSTIGQLHNMIRLDFIDWPLKQRSEFRLFREYLEWLMAGSKCTTVRYRRGHIDVPTAAYLPLFESSSEADNGLPSTESAVPVGVVAITELAIKPFGMLDEADAHRDGFPSREKLREALQQIYTPRIGEIGDNHLVSIYSIEFARPNP